jgi:DNA-binding beta-propeller fold protein YncE
LWIGANATSKAYRLSAADLSVASETETGPVPIRLAMHPSGKWVVSSNFGEGGLSVIDTDTGELARSIPVSGGQQAVQVTLVFSADGRRLYAAETATNTVAEIDFEKGEVIRRFEAGEGGDGLAVLTKPDH